MQKPSERFLSSDAGQRLNNRFLERFTCANAHAPQDSFQLGKFSLFALYVSTLPYFISARIVQMPDFFRSSFPYTSLKEELPLVLLLNEIKRDQERIGV